MRSSWGLCVVLLGACTPQQETGSPPTAPGGPPQEREQNIYIDSVEIANPLIVIGRARTFENNVALRARGSNGSIIAEAVTTSTGEMGHHNPCRATLWLTRHPGDSLTVEALEYSAKDGSEQSLVSVKKPFDVEPIEVQLYFPDQDCTRVAPYLRVLPKSISIARLLVEALIAGPTEKERAAGAAPAFPRGSAVASVQLRDGVLTVDFTERLQNVGGSCQAQMIRAAVTQTLQRLPAVQKAVITAGGSEALALQP